MQIRPDDVARARALLAVLAVVAKTGTHVTERTLAVAENRRTRVILVPDDVAELGRQHDGPDHALRVALRRDVEDAETGQRFALDGAERLAEQLVHAADHEHRDAVLSHADEARADAFEIGLDTRLPRILAATADDEVDAVGQFVAGVVAHDVRFITVPAQACLEAARVAEVAVDRHLPRVQVHERDAALARATRIAQCRRDDIHRRRVLVDPRLHLTRCRRVDSPSIRGHPAHRRGVIVDPRGSRRLGVRLLAHSAASSPKSGRS